jgi:ATP-binding cassette, subfamily B, heavy metal transporter
MRSAGFDPAEQGDSEAHFQTLKSMLPYVWPKDRPGLRLRVVIALGLLAAAKAITVYTPFFLKGAIDDLSAVEAAIAVPTGFIAAYCLARVLSQAFAEFRDMVFAKVGQHAIRSIALSTFRHMHGLSLRFHLERRTGGLSRVIERGTRGIDFLLRFTLFNIIPTILEIAFVGGIMLYNYGFELALITVGTVVGYIAFTFMITEWRLKYRREMNSQDTQANTKAIDSLLNFETVKYFSNEAHEANRYDVALARYERAAVKSQASLTLLNVGQGAALAIGLAAALILSARGVVAGNMTIGDFVLIHTLLLQMFMPLNFLGFVYREIKQSLVDMEKMFELLRVDTEIEDVAGAEPLKIDKGEVRFEQVAFSYESRRQILHDLSFTVPPSKTIAIVGPSGAGKSTISRLLYRFYDIQGGRILIDGQDIGSVTQASLRNSIGIVPQDTVLFNDTIRYNIRYGRPDATDEEVEAAAKHARIHDFIESLPDGYDSMVGERGLKLSGGEKQRVAIARTILKDPPILLLDEATSALDTHTEKEILASLDEVSANRTTLIIAHRLSTIVDADEILVLEQGRAVERGRHHELLERDGPYAAMWHKQQEAAEARARLDRAVEEGDLTALDLEVGE